MKKQPSLATRRLLLRPFKISDAAQITQLLHDTEIAYNTERISYPYEGYMAKEWIATHGQLLENDKEIIFAITNKSKQQLIGAIGLELELQHRRAQLGYWIAKQHWNQGFATEAVREIIKFAFAQLKLKRIYAKHFRSWYATRGNA